jgi:sensor c-di-GMP phosphodiesterase-like protein
MIINAKIRQGQLEQSTRDLEAAEARASAREELVTRQARVLEEEAALAAVDANSWRSQVCSPKEFSYVNVICKEVELIEKLSAVRTGLRSSESKREGLLQRINDLRVFKSTFFHYCES